jgi:hypothetical protein
MVMESGGRTECSLWNTAVGRPPWAAYQDFRSTQPVFDESGQMSDEAAQNVIFRLLSVSWNEAAGGSFQSLKLVDFRTADWPEDQMERGKSNIYGIIIYLFFPERWS